MSIQLRILLHSVAISLYKFLLVNRRRLGQHPDGRNEVEPCGRAQSTRKRLSSDS